MGRRVPSNLPEAAPEAERVRAVARTPGGWRKKNIKNCGFFLRSLKIP